MEEVGGRVLNMMVSEGVRPHQAHKSSVGIWFRQINLASYSGNCYCGVKLNHSRNELHRARQWPVPGYDFRVLFYFVSAKTYDHSSVCPRLCVSTSFW